MSQRPATAASTARTTGLPDDRDASGRSFGSEELEAVRRVLERGSLSPTHDGATRQFEIAVAGMLGVRFAIASGSESSAVQAAVAALDLDPGDEVVCSPLADAYVWGAVLSQGAIPVFADVDSRTGNPTAETLEARLSGRTRALLVTHLFGSPCDMTSIAALAKRHDLVVLEDCSQALLATHRHRFLGTYGAAGCFSLHQQRHLSCGEGGFVATDGDELCRRLRLALDPSRAPTTEEDGSDVLTLPSRLSELQGAVALAQLQKLAAGVQHRLRLAEELRIQIEGTPGLTLPRPDSQDRHTYWRMCLQVDPDVVPGGAGALAEALRRRGIESRPGTRIEPAYASRVVREKKTAGRSDFPFALARPEALDASPEAFPGTERARQRMLVLPWNERLTCEHVGLLAEHLRLESRRLIERGAVERAVVPVGSPPSVTA